LFFAVLLLRLYLPVAVSLRFSCLAATAASYRCRRLLCRLNVVVERRTVAMLSAARFVSLLLLLFSATAGVSSLFVLLFAASCFFASLVVGRSLSSSKLTKGPFASLVFFLFLLLSASSTLAALAVLLPAASSHE